MLQSFILYLQSLRERREEGQGLAEYALILALIAILVIGALLFLGGAIGQILSDIGNALGGAQGGG